MGGGGPEALVVDDHELVRRSLAELLRRDRRMGKVEEASGFLAAQQRLAGPACQLVVLDISLPDGDGMLLLQRVCRAWPEAVVLVYSGSIDAETGARLIQAGAAGHVHKGEPLERLMHAVDVLLFSGKRYAGGRELLAAETLRDQLVTEREQEVAVRIALSRSTKQIAEEMGLSPSTVDNHRTSLMKKLGVHDAAGVTRAAIQRGWVHLPQ